MPRRNAKNNSPSHGTGEAEITLLAKAAAKGNAVAAQQLYERVYQHLRLMAHLQMQNERVGHTLQTTALVNEAYLKLVGGRAIACNDRGHFFACAGQAMRHILLDYAKAHRRQKRQGGRRRIPLDVLNLAAEGNSETILSLDEAFRRLEVQSPEMGRTVLLRLYAGLSVEETASAMECSAATVKRRWEFARAWLRRELES